jgi:hypothetical protein
LRSKFFSALDLSEVEPVISSLPAEEQLFCLGLVLWLRNETFPPCLEHVLAALVAHVVLLDFEHSHAVKTRKRSNLEKSIESQHSTEARKEVARAKLALLDYFSVNTRVANSRKYYDQEIITYYECLKSLTNWAASLGALFGDPVPDLSPDKHYSGIFFFNLVSDLRRKQQPMDFILKDAFCESSTLISRLDSLLRLVLPLGLPEEFEDCGNDFETFFEQFCRTRRMAGYRKSRKKRRRNRLEAQVVVVDEDDVIDENEGSDRDGDDEEVYDAENRFAALKL